MKYILRRKFREQEDEFLEQKWTKYEDEEEGERMVTGKKGAYWRTG